MNYGYEAFLCIDNHIVSYFDEECGRREIDERGRDELGFEMEEKRKEGINFKLRV